MAKPRTRQEAAASRTPPDPDAGMSYRVSIWQPVYAKTTDGGWRVIAHVRCVQCGFVLILEEAGVPPQQCPECAFSEFLMDAAGKGEWR